MSITVPPAPASVSATSASPLSAFVALVVFSFRRQWRVRQMAWVAFGLTAVLAATIGVITHGPRGWGLENRIAWRYWSPPKKPGDPPDLKRELVTVRFKEASEHLDLAQALPLPSEATAIQFAVTGSFRAIFAQREGPDGQREYVSQRFLDDWAFLSFTRWVFITLYLGFLLPLFTLAYASGSIGGEREGRTLIWLLTRPLPRWAVYLAKLFGVLPWCLAASLGAFASLCLVGGEHGLRALEAYWPAAVAGTVAFTTLFQLIGAAFRRPAVVGLVYVFFFETLVASLPGSLKELSLNYYVRSLLYNKATAEIASVTPENLAVYAPTDPFTAWVTLLAASIGFTLLGMYVFGRQEPREEQ